MRGVWQLKMSLSGATSEKKSPIGKVGWLLVRKTTLQTKPLVSDSFLFFFCWSPGRLSGMGMAESFNWVPVGSEKQNLSQRASWPGVAQCPRRHPRLRSCQSVTVCWAAAPVVRQRFTLFRWLYVCFSDSQNESVKLWIQSLLLSSVSDPGALSVPNFSHLKFSFVPSGKAWKLADSFSCKLFLH